MSILEASVLIVWRVAASKWNLRIHRVRVVAQTHDVVFGRHPVLVHRRHEVQNFSFLGFLSHFRILHLLLVSVEEAHLLTLESAKKCTLANPARSEHHKQVLVMQIEFVDMIQLPVDCFRQAPHPVRRVHLELLLIFVSTLVDSHPLVEACKFGGVNISIIRKLLLLRQHFLEKLIILRIVVVRLFGLHLPTVAWCVLIKRKLLLHLLIILRH